MINFYRNSAILCLFLLVISVLIVMVGYKKSQVSTDLYPIEKADLKWYPEIAPEKPVGKTRMMLNSELGVIDYDFYLDSSQKYAYTHYSLNFASRTGKNSATDLTGYNRISFRILCRPENVLFLALLSHDDDITQEGNPITRRVSSAAFTCEEHWQRKEVYLDDLFTPDWWLSTNGLSLSDRGYDARQVLALAFINSLQSPREIQSHVRLDEIKLLGENQIYLNAALLVTVILWGIALAILIRYYIRILTEDLKEKLRMDRPLLAYKQLTIEPQKNKEKSLLLRHMATEYANSDISLDSTSRNLGINRTKINEILKEELGLTFSAYINKLRLTESARLLSQNSELTITEIAYAVGYNNVTYFNKLFKTEYGCTPKTFKTIDFKRVDKSPPQQP